MRHLYSRCFSVPSISTLCALVFGLLITGRWQSADAQCQSWVPLGAAGFSAGSTQYNQIAAAPDGTPYVLYSDLANDGKATVKKYNGSSWVTVGSDGFSDATIYQANLQIDNSGTPYVYSGGNTLMKFNGSTWVHIPVNAGTNGFLKLSPDGTPYIAYDDGNVTVLKYNGSTWDTLGSYPFLAGSGVTQGLIPSLAFDGSGTPYLSFGTSTFGTSNSDIFVYKYNGTEWDMVGSGAIYSGELANQSPLLAISSTGIPYVGYYAVDDAATHVKKFDGSTWTTVGSSVSGFASPRAIATDNAGRVYISINGGAGVVWVARYDDSGVIITGNGGVSYDPWSYEPFVAVHNNTHYVVYNDYLGRINVRKMLELTTNNSSTSTTICAGGPITLSNATTGGYWSSANSAVASVGSSTGIVAGVASGVAAISYTLGTCSALTMVTVNPFAGYITGFKVLNAGTTTSLRATVLGGTWTSGNAAIATISSGGIVSGVAPGTATISYGISGACGSAVATTVVTVNAASAPTCVTWKKVGGPANTSSSLPSSTYPLATVLVSTAPDGTPYVLTADATNSVQATVKKYNGSDWVVVGTEGFTTGQPANMSMCFDGAGTPYVAYQDYYVAAIHVMKFDGSSWIELGHADALYGGGYFPSIAVTGSGDVFLQYATGLGTIMLRYNGTDWVDLGVLTDLSGYFYPSTNLVCDKTGVPYVAQYTPDSTLEIYKFDGGHWQTTPSCSFSPSGINQMKLAIDNDGIFYIAYSKYDDYTIRTLKFDGTTWSAVGDTINEFSSDLSIATAADGSLYMYSVDNSYGSEQTMRKLSGGTWETVANNISTWNGIASFALSADGTPYLVSVQGRTDSSLMNYYFDTWVSTAGLFDNTITGPATVCNGTSALFENTSVEELNSWTPIYTDTVAASADGAGHFYFFSAGVSTISYTAGGCIATKTVTVNSGAAPTISGTLALCNGTSTTLSSPIGGGTWSCDNTSVATVGSATGNVTGVGNGTATISYVVSGGCGTGVATVIVTVSATPSAGSITGTLGACVGTGTTLSSTVTGGTWTSGDAAVATIDPSTGIVTAVIPGTSTITYSANTTCGAATTTATVTVNPTTSAGSITGTMTVCAGANTTLSNTVTGGTWTSSNTGVASVNTSTGIVSGASAGNTTITYTMNGTCGTATTTAVVTVNSAPSAGTITGTRTVCTGANTTLGNIAAGGVWSSSNSNATVSDGLVTGVIAGTTTISYTVSNTCGSNIATAIVTVNAAPLVGTITGATTVTAGSTITLADATTGGNWSASNGNVTVTNGIVTGVTAGTTTISYTVSNTCGSNAATAIVTVNAGAPSGITGTLTVCGGATTTLSSTPGGVWSSMNNGTATVGSTTGIVSGISPGVATIKYTLAGTVTTVNVTVNAQPNSITGAPSLCQGGTLTLTSTTTGATWSSGNTSVATIGTSGIVSGVGAGTTTISYTGSNGCARTTNITVYGRPDITGTTIMCAGSTATLSASMTGGAWGGGSAVATVNNGVVSGLTAGTTNINYVVGSCYNTVVVTVVAQPATISGIAKLCPASTVTLTDATTGGTWSGTNSSITTVDAATGAITGIATGTALVSYTAPNGCSRSVVATVNPVPAAIGGTASTCAGSTTTLTNSSPAYSWTSGNTGVATITSTGIVVGVSAGTANITFTASGTGCTANTVVTINGTPAAIGGSATACIGATTTLTNTTSGGSWSSGNTSIATIDAVSGVVTGAAAGSVTMTYATGSGCYKTKTLTVGIATVAIAGTPTACIGGTTTLTSWGSGTWSSSNTAIANIPTATTGTVQGMSAGTAIITFLPTGACPSVTTVTVVTPPAPITGTTVICSGQASSLSTTSTGGTWSSSNTAVATVGSATGVVNGVGNSGTVTITYAYNGSCRTTTAFTVNVLPNLVGGTYSVCASATTTLSDITPAGTWSSSNTAVATVGTGMNWGYGAVSGLTAGTTNISYTISATGCARSVVVTVDPCGRPMGNQPATTAAFELYPNPTTGAFTVVTESVGTLQVFTLDGREVAQYPISNGINNLVLSKELTSGVYMCRYNTSDGNTIIVRLVLEH